MQVRNILLFLIKVCSFTILFTTILIALFGISNKKFSPNSHIEKSEIRNKKPETSRNQGNTSSSDTKENNEDRKAFQQDLDNLLTNEHRDAYVDTLKSKNWCSLDQEICDKITRASDYSSYQKLRYQTITIGLINQLDNLIQQGNTSRQCLNWIKIYKDEVAARGSATHTSIKMNTQPLESYREYRQVLTHELGHIIDLCGLDDQKSSKDNLFTEFGEKVFGKNDPSLEFYKISRISERVRKPNSSSKDFISGYAAKNPFEDFAETQQAYLNHPRKFLELAESNTILMKKYQFFKDLYKNMNFNIAEYPSKVSSIKTRVWDTTKWE